MGIIAHTMEYRGAKLPPGPDLRNYRDSDYESYRQLYNAGFAEMRAALGLTPIDCCCSREELMEKSGDIFLLEKDGKLAGTVAVYGSEIDDLVVAKAYQGQGIGKSLLLFATARILAAGSVPTLHVADWNQTAVRLYEHNGFVIINTETV